MLRRALVLLVVLVGLAAGRAEAVVIFSDNFNGENGGVGVLNYTGFANFTVSGGTVDLIGNGFFDLLPGNGLYVDLDGSSFDAGVMTKSPAIPLAPGTYTLSFDLAGNRRVLAPDSVTVNVFGGLNPSYGSLALVVPSADPFINRQIPFTLLLPDSVQFSFSNAGGDNIGALLDDVTLDDRVIPEPTSLLLLGSGLLGLGRRARRKLTR